MCPFCLATAAWMAAAVSTGGVTALVLKRTTGGKGEIDDPTTTPTKEDHHG
jgi:hypothetical protein